VGGGWFGWSVLQAFIEKSFAPMRNLLKSLFAGSNNVCSTSFMKENASMIRSTRLGQLALGLLVAFAGSAKLQAADLNFLAHAGLQGGERNICNMLLSSDLPLALVLCTNSKKPI
jgi:hypothetical protein